MQTPKLTTHSPRQGSHTHPQLQHALQDLRQLLRGPLHHRAPHRLLKQPRPRLYRRRPPRQRRRIPILRRPNQRPHPRRAPRRRRIPRLRTIQQRQRPQVLSRLQRENPDAARHPLRRVRRRREHSVRELGLLLWRDEIEEGGAGVHSQWERDD